MRLVTERRLEAAPPATKAELDDLRAMVDRNLRDAELHGLSDEGRFEMAYNAARVLSVMAIRASGYRVKLPAAHYNTFLSLQAITEPRIASMSAYLNTCREKRNEFSYEKAFDVTTLEAEELLRKTKEFRQVVENWLGAHYPHLVKL